MGWLVWVVLGDAVFWAAICGVIWAAKGGDWVVAALMGGLFSVFAALYFAFATPQPQPLSVAAADISLLPAWRERRIGPAGWIAVGVTLTAIALVLILSPRPG